HEVRRPRAGRREAHTRDARRLRVAVGGVGRALLVPAQDVTDGRVEQRIVGRQDRAARDTEDVLYALPLQRVNKRLGAADLLSRLELHLVTSCSYFPEIRKTSRPETRGRSEPALGLA